jgi:predicted small secreted protein
MKLIERSIRWAMLAAVTVSVLGLGNLACNTTEGAGKDVEAGGKALKHAAQDAKD